MRAFYYLCICALISSLSACHKKDLQPQDPFLKTDKSILTEMPGQVSDTIIISSSVNWKVTLPSWIHSNTTSGFAGKNTLILQIDANGGTAIRTDNIIISPASNDAAPGNVTINITQGGSDPFIITNRSMLAEDSIGQIDSIVITANTSWILSIPNSASGWITADKNSGNPGSTKIYFTILSNPNSTLQSADISITSSNTSLLPIKITIYQVVNYQIQNILPNGGVPGDTILINGTFGPNPNVTINNVHISLLYADSSKILFIVPDGLSVGNLNIRFGTTILTSQKNFIPYSITSFTNHGQTGDLITFTGGFAPNAIVKFNGVESTNVTVDNTNKTLTCTVPAGVTAGPVKIYLGKDSLITSTNFTVTNVWLEIKQISNPLNIQNGISFVYNGDIYWGLGSIGSSFNNIFYILDANGNWINGPSIPAGMSGRSLASAYVLNSIVYLGLGFNSSFGNLSDWWQFNPSLNGNQAWTQLTSYPSQVSNAMSFVENGIGYVSFGSNGNLLNNAIYRFDYSNNSIWTNVGGSGSGAIGRSSFTIGNLVYYGGGVDASNMPLQDFYSLDPVSNILITQQSIPATTISSANEIAPSFSYDNKGYIISHYNELYEYDPGSNSWINNGPAPNINYVAVNKSGVYGWDNAGNVYEYIPNY